MSLPESDMAALQDALDDEAPDGLREALINQRCFRIYVMQEVRAWLDLLRRGAIPNATAWDRARAWYGRVSGRIYREADFDLLLDREAQRIEAMKLPARERFAMLEHLQPGVARNGGRASLALVLAEGSENIHPRAARGEATVIARIRAARTTLAIERWRLAHGGSPPDSLADLVPGYLCAVPADPFDDRALRYRKLTRGYVVYGLGPDFIDDGGMERPAHAGAADRCDVTFTVER
jgi:hypothetical protein